VSAGYDAVVIGAGHNGLVAASYLARAGARVCVVERREVLGGACVTEELVPGTRSSSCAFVAAPGLHPEVLRDLDLRAHGLAMYQTPVLGCLLTERDTPLVVWADVDRTLRVLTKRFGRREAEGFLALGSRLRRFARFMRPSIAGPPPPLSELEARFGSDRDLFREFTEASMREVLDRYLESDQLRGMFAYLAMTGVHGAPSTPGTSFVFAYHSWGEYEGRFGETAFVRGGMGAISDALAACARAAGADVIAGVPVERILVRDGAAAGVALADGSELGASLVVSGADPRRTFVEMLSPDDLDPAFLDAVRGIDFRGSLGRVHVAVDRLPAFEGVVDDDEYQGWTLLGSGMDELEAAGAAQEAGRIPGGETLPVEFVTQSFHDASLAQDGRHVIVTGVQQLPSATSDGTWDDNRAELERRVVNTLEKYAPGLRERVIGTHTITPLDLERTYGLTGGNLFHGAMSPEQIFERRPLPGMSGYETPVTGLLLCGSGTHPGGGVTGIPGHNAAQVALRLLGRTAATKAAGGERRRVRSAVTAAADRLLDSGAARRAVVTASQSERVGAVLRRLGR
jgi:phytoene dehydrogenase-like protein